MPRKNITFIEDLQDIGGGIGGNGVVEDSMIPSDQASQINKKFIRNHDRTPNPQSGMISNNNYIQPYQHYPPQQYYMMNQQPYYPQQLQPYPLNTRENYDGEEDADLDVDAEYEPSSKRLNKCIFINCRDISCHVSECPVCSKLYKSDSTIYIIMIVLLSCIVLFLLQKLFYVNKMF
jgi:hypothetical protein